MKQFRPYRFPPLSQFVPPAGRVNGAGNAAADAAQWQASLSEGFEQGQRDGYEIGLQRGQEDRQYRRRADVNRNNDYVDGMRGYRSEYGDRSVFQQGYRDGFRQGYEDGFRNAGNRWPRSNF